MNYDDQSNPATVPGIYTKLLDVDKVDLIVSGYATNMVAPAIPIAMQRGKVFIGLFALDANGEFHYPKYFSMLPSGPTPKESFTEGFFQIAAAQNPKPQTIAIAAEDADFSHNAADGARANVKKYGFKIGVRQDLPAEHDRLLADHPRHPGGQSGSCGVLLLPAELGRPALSANELGLKPKMMGGAMVGLQATVFKNKLKSKLNGIVNYETWVPSPKLMAPAADFFKIYQSRAPGLGIDPLGYYLGGWGYAYFQVLQQAIEGTKSINDDKLAAYMRSHPFNTIMASDIKFGKNGEWTKSGMLQVQYHGITDAAEPRDLARHELSDRAHARRREDRQRHLSVREGAGISVEARGPRMTRRGAATISCFCLTPMASGLSPAVRPGPIKQKTRSVEEPHELSHNAPRRQCRHRRRSPVTRARNNDPLSPKAPHRSKSASAWR